MNEETQASTSADEDWGAALAEQAGAGDVATDGSTAGEMTAGEDQYQKAGFQNLEDDATEGRLVDSSLDMILDIPVTLAVEIGRSKIRINNLLKLNQGSVVELDRLAGEPMDVIVNGTLIAHGEIVVVNEKFGIRLTDIISPTERVKKLQ